MSVTPSKEIPAPSERWYIRVFNLLMDMLLEGVTANVAYAALIAEFPMLAGWFTKWVIDKFFDKVNERIKIVGDKGLLKLGNEFRKISYNDALRVLKEHDGDVTEDQLKIIRAAVDRIIRRA